MLLFRFHYTRDYTTNYDPITNACASLAFREIPALRQLREHNANVQRTLSLDNMRRYARYNIRLSSNTTISQADKNKRMADEKKIVDDAISNYRTTSDQYLAVINNLGMRLDATSVMQQCQEMAQTAYVGQMSTANALISSPVQLCDEFNSIYARFQQAMDAAYRKIGAQPPRK